MAAAVLAGCSNDELTSESFNGQAKIDATNFSLVNIKGGVNSRIITVPGYDEDGAESGTSWVIPAQEWEEGDQIGFSHIYRVNQEITTNYNFKIKEAADIDAEGNAVFKTDNSTIFAGDYFVYAPFNEKYADYNGVPVEIPAYQSQDVTSPIKASDVLDVNDPTSLSKFQTAVDHLTKFSISNRITADAQVNQQEFTLNEFTTTLYLKLYPVNQTKDIKVHRIEITCDENFATSGRFLAEAGKNAPVFHASEVKEDKVILAFKKLLEIDEATLEADAHMGYISLLPGTYSNLKFKIFYTETENLKIVEVEKNISMNFESNTAYRINLPIDANGAVEATSYDIYTEAEFKEAVTKSNAMNAGTSSEAVFNLMKDITLTDSYTFGAKVPVTFNGGKTLTLSENNGLVFDAEEKIDLNCIVSSLGEADNKIQVMKGEVEIDGVAHKKIVLKNNGKTTILNNADLNEDDNFVGALKSVENTNELTLANVAIRNGLANGKTGAEVAILDLSNATIGEDLNANSAITGSVTLNNVDIERNWINTQGNTTATDVTVGGYWTNTAGNVTVTTATIAEDLTHTAGTLTAEGVTVEGAYFADATAGATSMKDVTVKGAFTQTTGCGELSLSGNNNLGWKTVSGTATSTGFTTSSKVNVTDGTTTLGAATIGVEMNVAGTVEAKFTTDLNAIVKVATTGKYIAQGALNNLQNSTMELEGTLETADAVVLADDFSYCGTINNKATGKWLLISGRAVSQHNHAHGSTAVFNNEGEVVVEGVNETASLDIQNMPKNLYNKVSNGRLVWKGMTTVAKIAEFVALDAEQCWATDFNAVVSGAADVLTTAAAWDWSAFNIIIDATTPAHTTTITSGKPLTVKNLTINLVSGNMEFAYTKTTAEPTGLKVAEKMVITNVGTATPDLEYTNCTTLVKDLEVKADEAKAMKVYKAAAELKYTDTFTQINTPNINFVNGSPEKAN